VTGRRSERHFGPTLRPDGKVRFRFWAPAVSAVSLRLEEPDRLLPMAPRGEGWFELVTGDAWPGSRYLFELPDGSRVPDPASHRQAEDVHGASIVVDPAAYAWRHPDWKGRPWHEAVIYELHIGSFSPGGNFAGVARRLPALAELGITAVELMPIADFPGGWNWGYDGVLPYAPDSRYGTPEDLKALIDAAHGLGLMIFLDVVYNHFGPEGNYLHRYAPQTFTDRHHTPWGSAIDFSRPPVRDYFADNAAYWIEEFRFDGLRLDAVHAIIDDQTPHMLQVIAARARAAGGHRKVHLILENEHNRASLLDGGLGSHRHMFDAQWNDDFHHAAHVLLTGENAAYYADYVERPVAGLGRALAEGFVYQGEISAYRGRPRGEPSAHLPPTAFVNFLQNHDQIGNRGFGDRLTQLSDPAGLRAMMAILLLAPAIPMLFMGEEHGAAEPFLFFVDFEGELAEAVRKGRRRELERFPGFHPEEERPTPDPCARASLEQSAIDWSMQSDALHAAWLRHCRELLAIRAREIMPRLDKPMGAPAFFRLEPGDLLTVQWEFGDGDRLTVLALPSATPRSGAITVAGRPIWMSEGAVLENGALRDLPPWFTGWFLAEARRS